MQLQTIGFVLLVVLQSASSDLEDSIGEFHFTISDVVGNFSDAMSWCKSNNSTLAVVKDNVTQKALARFLNSSHLTSMMYMNFKLYQIDNNTWFLLNGSNYYGNIGNQIDRDSNYSLFSCLLYDVNASVIQASAPSDFRNYICDYNADRYPNNSANNIVYDGRCYVKYESESLTWYQARERCINNGGDLAQFQNGSVSNPWIVPFNTSWLDQSLTYWLGIRWNGWSWKSFDDSEEIIYTSFSVGKPSTFNYSCVCVDPRGNPAWSWTDCDCTEERPFVCLQIIPTTTTATTTSPIANPATATTAGLIVGVVLGLGVILPLAIITLVVIVWNVRLRRRLRDYTRNSEQVTTTTGSAQVDAAETDAQYQHLKRDTVFAPGTAVPHYDQLKNPEDPNYEMAITSSETIGD